MSTSTPQNSESPQVPGSVSIPGWRHLTAGKVRELYVPEADNPDWGDDVVLVVASDRISAYDHVLSTPIPAKGAILTALSVWWLD